MKSVKRTCSLLLIAAAALLVAPGALASERDVINFTKDQIGAAPSNFEFAVTGVGSPGYWTVIREVTTTSGIALEHVSTETQEDRFPLAVYSPLQAENAAVSVRFKIVSGTMQTAGVAVGVRSPNSYYVVSANALEHRVDLMLFLNGKVERIDSAEAEVRLDQWHQLAVKVNDDHFAISFDGRLVLTTYDRTRRKDGRIALWTQEDNVTRFDAIEVVPLPTPDFTDPKLSNNTGRNKPGQ